MSDFVDAVIEANGGLERWKATPYVRLHLSSGGLAFAMKGQPQALRDVDAFVATQDQDVHLYAAGDRAHLRREAFTLRRADGSTIESNADSGSFRGARRLLHWNRADILRFAALAIWTYASIPFVLAREEIETELLDPWRECRLERWHRLAVRFPDHLHTHSAEQVLYFDERLRLRRHDYTAEAFGTWAKAAHYASDYQELDGFPVARRRRVHPRKRNGRRRRRPLLVWIDVDRVSRASTAELG